MASSGSEDAFSQFDHLLLDAGYADSPWSGGHYLTKLDLLRNLLTLPVSQGDKQETGRPAKALDAWIAHELRRAGFSADAVWPRTKKPRVLPEGLSDVESCIDALAQQLKATEAQEGRLKNAALRRAIRAVEDLSLGASDAYILGDFYAKQIDVGMSSWKRGPDLLVSTKTMFSAYRKNLKNRHEEAVGEVMSLRRRHPMAAMGYVYLVRDNLFEEDGAYAILFDILKRLRRPGEAFDATLLLVAEWGKVEDEPEVFRIDQPATELNSARFFSDLIGSVLDRTPVGEHQRARLLRDGSPPGGIPDEEDIEVESDPG